VRCERRQQPISGEDAWIAATALTHGCPLVTHNAADFQGIAGLIVISEAV
jgi:predicted nucleic acid-binding protein